MPSESAFVERSIIPYSASSSGWLVSHSMGSAATAISTLYPFSAAEASRRTVRNAHDYRHAHKYTLLRIRGLAKQWRSQGGGARWAIAPPPLFDETFGATCLPPHAATTLHLSTNSTAAHHHTSISTSYAAQPQPCTASVSSGYPSLTLALTLPTPPLCGILW